MYYPFFSNDWDLKLLAWYLNFITLKHTNGILQILDKSRRHVECQNVRGAWLHIASTKVINIGSSQITYSVPKIKFGEIKNLLDVLTQYKILGFCRLGWNRMKFYQTKTWDIMTENQISVDCRFYWEYPHTGQWIFEILKGIATTICRINNLVNWVRVSLSSPAFRQKLDFMY